MANYKVPEEDRKVLEDFEARKKQLIEFRKNAYGVNLEELMRHADIDYALKPLNNWRRNERNRNRGENLRLVDNRVDLRTTDEWQSDNSDAVVFSKIQTALAQLFDRNPGAVMTASSKRYTGTTELARVIFENSQHKERFKNKIKVFVFNLAKYGWSYGRTYIREDIRTFKDLTQYNPVTKKKTYKEHTVDNTRVHFESLEPWNVWVDDNARPYRFKETADDWLCRITYTDEALKKECGDTEVVREAIKCKSGAVLEQIDGDKADTIAEVGTTRTDLNEGFYYESKSKDMLLLVVNGKLIKKDILPVHKDLSLMSAFWNLRSGLHINGVGIPEILRQDKNLLNKIRNMSVDQLVLSIYKMFFYDGTNNTEEADLQIRPGKGQKLLDPSKLKWLEVPAGGQEAYQREAALRQDMDDSTGITKQLSGALVSDRDVKALALQQSKEASLSKLKTPLDNIIEALEQEAELRWKLIQELNMMPREVEKIVDPDKAADYLQEIENNKELFYHDEGEQVVYALHYPEISAKLKKGDDGVYKPSEERNYFVVTPDSIRWNGEIRFDAESILVVSKELQKQMDLDMANLLIPLFAGPPETNLKPAKQILRIYGKNNEDWLPDAWLSATPTSAVPVPVEEAGGSRGGMPTVVPERETIPGNGTTNIVDKTMAAGV